MAAQRSSILGARGQTCSFSANSVEYSGFVSQISLDFGKRCTVKLYTIFSSVAFVVDEAVSGLTPENAQIL